MDETLDLGLGIKAAGAVEAQRTTKSLIGSLKDYVKGLFSVRDASKSVEGAYSSKISTMNSADAVYQKMSDSFGKLKRRFMAFVGVYAASDIFKRLYEEGKKVEEMVVRLANRFGSDAVGNKMTRWVNETVARLPVARDELENYIMTLDQIALPASMTNLEGVLNASLNTGQDLNSVLGQLVDFAKSNDIVGLSDFFAGRISPQEISRQLAGAQSIQERVVRLTELMDQKFEGNIERTRRTIGGQLEILGSIARLFKQNVIGFAGSGGFYDEIKAFINDFVGWFEDRKDVIMEFAGELQGFLLQMFRFVRQQFLSMGSFTESMFQTMRRFVKNSREIVNPFVLFIAILTERMKSLFSGFLEGFELFFVELNSMIRDTMSLFNDFFVEFLGVDAQEKLDNFSIGLSKLFNTENVENFGKALGFVGGIMTTFIAVSWGLGKIVAIVKGLAGAWGAVSGAMAAHPIVAGVLAIIGAVILLRKAWVDNWGDIQGKLAPIISWLNNSLTSTRDFLVDLWSSVSSEVSGFVNEITPALQKIWTILKPISSLLFVGFVENLKLVGKTLWSFIKGTLTIGLNSIVNAWKIAWEFVTGTIEVFLKLLTGDFAGAWSSFKDMVSGIADIVGDQFMMVGKTVLNFFKETGGHILEFFDGFWEGTKKVFLGIFNWFIDKINAYILEPLNEVSSKIGLSVPTLSRIGEGERTVVGNQPSPSQRLIRPQIGVSELRLQPARADNTRPNQINQFSGSVSINVDGSGDPKQTAHEVRKELEQFYRRQKDRAE